ncbi:MAG: hypothetical protein JWL77_3583 [Chthonomonadaceae bacterium]|nr:hypothetical protein [Chthonomonadaceae bacterium]
MACDTPIGAPVTVTVEAGSGIWVDTGMTVNAGECLQITALGNTVKFGVNADQCAYPEGYYSGAGNPCGPQSYDPTAVLATYGGDGANPYVTLEQPPYCLLAKIAAAQPTGTHLTGTLRPNRGALFPASALSGGGRVWLVVNDNIFGDNSGSWTVTLQRLVTALPAPPMITTGGDTGQGSRPGVQSEEIYQSLAVFFPGGYLTGVNLASQPTLFHTLFTSVRICGPYRAYLVGSILHVVNDAGELPNGTPLEGVEILRIGT